MNISRLLVVVSTATAFAVTGCSNTLPPIWLEGSYSPQQGCVVKADDYTTSVADMPDKHFEVYRDSAVRSVASVNLGHAALSSHYKNVVTVICGFKLRNPKRLGEFPDPTSVDLVLDLIAVPADTTINVETTIKKIVLGRGAAMWDSVRSPEARVLVSGNGGFRSGFNVYEATKGVVVLKQKRGAVDAISFKVFLQSSKHGL